MHYKRTEMTSSQATDVDEPSTEVQMTMGIIMQATVCSSQSLRRAPSAPLPTSG